MKLRDAMRFDAGRAALYLKRGWWSPSDTLSQWLIRAATERPDAPAIAGDGQSLSYGALAQRVAALAGGLKAIGLGSGDVVAVQLPNRAEYLVCYLAICAIGGVMTTLYMPHRAAEMEPLLAHSGARAFIGLDEIGGFRAAQTALDLRSRIATLEQVLVLGDAPDGARSLADLTGAAAHDLSDGPVAADPFLLLYTSGTSSGPKGVPLAYRGILGNARLAVAEHGITAADRILSAPRSGISTASTPFTSRWRPVRAPYCCPRSRRRTWPGFSARNRSPSCSPRRRMSPPAWAPGCRARRRRRRFDSRSWPAARCCLPS